MWNAEILGNSDKQGSDLSHTELLITTYMHMMDKHI